MLKRGNVTVSVQPRRARAQLVFRVAQLIDCGTGRPKVTLECVAYGGPGRMEDALDIDFEVPDNLAHVDLLYTRVGDARRLLPYQRIENLYESAQIKEIVADVVRPGDVIVMEREPDHKTHNIVASSKAKCRIYRVMQKSALNNKGQNKHAL